jgi:hypothetical protein
MGFQQFSFNQIPSNSQNWALGGQVVTSIRQKFNNFTENPALITTSPTNQLELSLSPYLGNTFMSNLSFSRIIKQTPVGFFCRFLDYGNFEKTDLSGNKIGKFNANDFMLGFGLGKKKGNISFGTNLKVVGSSIELYTAYAAMLSLGATFQHPKKDFQVGFTINNLGYQFKNYFPSQKYTLPIQINIGTSFKPQFMPLIFSVSFGDFQKIVSPDIDSKTNFSYMIDKFSIGTNVLISKQIQFQIGYRGQDKDLSTKTYGSFAGLSFGTTITSTKFNFGYSYANYHVSGGIHCFTTTYQFAQKD